MSVFVKGMNMPRSCKQCEMFNLVKSINDFRCCANDEWHEADFDYQNERHPDCPLVEIHTPHGRLIDAEAYLYYGDLIDEPTIIEAEVGK